MCKITQKLRGRRGASLILAMVFMLMCLFVGGSVLAAATANGGRVADMASNQQSYLSQRSAALLMADMLEDEEHAPLQLTIKTVSVTENGGTPAVSTTYSLHGTGERSNLQRVLVENAIEKYRNARGCNGESFSGFAFPGFSETNPYSAGTDHLYEGTTDSTGKYKIGKISITEPNTAQPLKAFFASPYPSAGTVLSSDVFDLTISFEDNAQLRLYIKATYSESTSDPITQDGRTTTTTTTVIQWDDPVIEKGGFTP